MPIRPTIAEFVKKPLTEGLSVDDTLYTASSGDQVRIENDKGIFTSQKRGTTFYLKKSNTCQENDPKASIADVAKGEAIPGCVLNITNKFGFPRGQIVSLGDGKSKDVPMGYGFYYAPNHADGGYIFNTPNGHAAGAPVDTVTFSKNNK